MKIFIQSPVNQSAPLRGNATFWCLAAGVVNIYFKLNSMAIGDIVHIGVHQSEPVNSDSGKSVSITVPVTKSTDNWSVVCTAVLPNGTVLDSPPAYIQGVCYSIVT